MGVFNKMNKLFENKRVCNSIIGIVVVCVLLFCSYIFVLQPIVVFCSPFTEFETYQGMDYYNSGDYKELEMGSQFIDTFLSYEVAEDCEIIDFFYRDYKPYDSIVYGKKADIYAIDLYTGEDYEAVKSYVVEEGTFFTELSKEGQTVRFYLMPNDVAQTGLFLFALEDTYGFLRFVLISDRTESDFRFNSEIRDSLDGGPSFVWDMDELFANSVWSNYKTVANTAS